MSFPQYLTLLKTTGPITIVYFKLYTYYSTLMFPKFYAALLRFHISLNLPRKTVHEISVFHC